MLMVHHLRLLSATNNAGLVHTGRSSSWRHHPRHFQRRRALLIVLLLLRHHHLLIIPTTTTTTTTTTGLCAVHAHVLRATHPRTPNSTTIARTGNHRTPAPAARRRRLLHEQPIIHVPERVLYKRLILVVPPLPVHDKLILMVPGR